MQSMYLAHTRLPMKDRAGRDLYCDKRLGREYWYIGYPRDADMRVVQNRADVPREERKWYG
jgi:hypothetical protein